MIFIHGIAHFHPEQIIDNQFLTDLNIGTSDEWIMERVGIESRRTVMSLDYIRKTYNNPALTIGSHIKYTNAQTGSIAASRALKHANLSAKDIGMVIAGGCLPQYSLPAEACMIAAELGIEAPAFDINSACSTFAIHMHFLQQASVASLPDYILLVIPENMTRCVNFTDRKVAVLLGDGTSALVVSKKHASNAIISGVSIGSNPGSYKTIMTPAGLHFSQEGPVVQRFAIKKMVSIIEQFRNQYSIEVDDHYFIGHQANLTMLKSICKIVKIREDLHLYNVHEFGNCGAAGAPSVLSQYWSSFVRGDQIILAVVGAGLTWGGMLINFM
jgi:3-oxoacyl-[acyl-carrier-protein] synthase III